MLRQRPICLDDRPINVGRHRHARQGRTIGMDMCIVGHTSGSSYLGSRGRRICGVQEIENSWSNVVRPYIENTGIPNLGGAGLEMSSSPRDIDSP